MKFLISIAIITFIVATVYFFSSRPGKQNKKHKKVNWTAIILSALVAFLLLGFLAFKMYQSATALDSWCITIHQTSSTPSASLKTATDYFNQGNYDFDKGSCIKAVEDYSKSVKLDGKNAKALNNRAYTYMRIRDYKDALTDLDKALELDPNYVNALMNRGDIYNFYLPDRQKAVADYEKVIALGGTKGTSVCGHLLLARHNGWNFATILGIPFSLFSCK